ncbi:hypothetical protein Bca52824_011282 [Brassica carinata]|uniref:Ubiquitin-like protease family profile domain-containing protein n=1 Tax=Brassica carinata TaxID=52824 RepID=A0A8X8B8C8_BRACI|nr:hypothetical protein Bca52824_011282 [Brassica carinata]
MTTSNSGKTYPARLYEEGKCPLQHRSMNHNCHLANLQMAKEDVGLDAWESIKTSSVGVILRLKELNYTWSAKAVHHLLPNQLVVNNIQEIWSAIEGQPIRFSLYEFGDITGLNCEPFNINDKVEIDHKPFWEELGVSPSHGPMLSEVYYVSCSRIPLDQAKRVLDIEAFDRYPWGRVGFSSLVNSVKIVSYEGRNKYTLRGRVHALLIWGNHIEGNQVPLLSWSGSRGRINWDLFYIKEKSLHKKVRVRHLIDKPEAEIYPQWPEDKVDDDLHNLITDILHGELDDMYWNLNSRTAPVPNKEKRKLHACGSSLNSTRDDTFQLGLMEAMNTLTAKVGSMNTVIVQKVLTAVDTSVDVKVNAGIAEAELVFTKKISTLQEDIAQLREQMQATAPKNDAHYNVNHEDEVHSNDPSWMVQDKASSQMDAAVQCVVRKKAKKSEVKLTSPILLDTVKKTARGLKNVKKETVEIPQLRDSRGTWSNSEDKKKYGKVGATLDQLAASVLDGPLQKRKPQLTKTQVYPYVGNSTVKRIIPGDSVSKAHYDPLAKLITPRNDWETDDFCWLTDSHMPSAMLMFHKRHMRKPSPYCSDRIAFLEHWFVKMWVRDYKKYDHKTWKFSETYRRSSMAITLLKVDLQMKTIHVYDSIQTIVPSITDLQEECRRKKSSQQFKISRLKKVPQNEDPGDYGVYALKYIECKAIGCDFEVLSDQCIPAMRIKLAVEIYDEVSGL